LAEPPLLRDFRIFAISFSVILRLPLPGSGLISWHKIWWFQYRRHIFYGPDLAIALFPVPDPFSVHCLPGTIKSWRRHSIELWNGLIVSDWPCPSLCFALFPMAGSLPKSGGWLGPVKVVLGFLELAMAIKLLSNADLVEQWGIVKREIFIDSGYDWGTDHPYLLVKSVFRMIARLKKFSASRIGFLPVFRITTIYLVPGLQYSCCKT